MEDIHNVAEGVLGRVAEPSSTKSQTHQSVDNEDPSKEINGIKGHRIGKILDGNLVGTPCDHGEDGQQERNRFRFRYKHSRGISNCIPLFSACRCAQNGSFHRSPRVC